MELVFVRREVPIGLALRANHNGTITNRAWLQTRSLELCLFWSNDRRKFIFISWWTFPKKHHILFIRHHVFTNTLLKTSYVDEQCPRILICYFSPFISCLSHFIPYLSLFIYYLSHFIGYLTCFISCLSLIIPYLTLFSS